MLILCSSFGSLLVSSMVVGFFHTCRKLICFMSSGISSSGFVDCCRQ